MLNESSENLKVRSGIRIISIIAVILSLLDLYVVNKIELFSLFSFFIWGLYIVGILIFMRPLWQGKEWARVVWIISAIINCIYLPFSFMTQESMPGLVLTGCDFVLTVIILIYFNKKKIRSYFHAMPIESDKKKKFPVGWIILVSIILLIGLAGFFGFQSFKTALASTKLGIEPLFETASRRNLDFEGAAANPFFSPDNKVIYFQRMSKGGGIGIADSNIALYHLETDNVENIMIDQSDTYALGWCGEDHLLYGSKIGEQRDLMLYSISDKNSKALTDDSAFEREARCSPDGQNVVFVQEDEKGKNQIFKIAVKGASEKIKLTDIEGFLDEPKNPNWLADSTGVIFISFIRLHIIDLEGKEIKRIDLTGLNNIVNPMNKAFEEDWIFFKGRPANDSSFNNALFRVNRQTNRIEVLKENRSILEVSYDISQDGKSFVSASPQNNRTPSAGEG